MAQREIPFLFMRGGTSRGPYFNAADLPSDRDAIAKILLQAVGCINECLRVIDTDDLRTLSS